MKRTKKGILIVVLVAFALFINGCATQDVDSKIDVDTWPEKPITWNSIFTAGGMSDLSLRALAEGVEKKLGVPIVVENVVGAAGAAGVNAIAKAKPDGYTFGLAVVSTNTVLPYFEDVGYDPAEDFEYIAQYVTVYQPVAVKADSSWDTWEDMISWAKNNPGKLKWSAASAKGAQAIATEAVFKEQGIEATFVPFQGGAECMAALLGGHVDATIVAEYIGPLEAGEVRLLAECGPVKIKGYEDVPTYKELGYPLHPMSFYGVAGPKGISQDIVDKLESAIREVVESDDFYHKMEKLNIIPIYVGSNEFNNYVRDAYADMGEQLLNLGMIE